MEDKLEVRNTITIKSAPERVWDALTNPAQTKTYMFGCETVSDWKPGSPLLWKGTYEGREMVFVKGTIIDIQPPQRLVYTTLDPNGSVADRPENYLTVTYELNPRGEETILTVSQGDFSKVAEGEKRYQDSSNGGEGWNPILEQIKKLVEG